MRNSKTNEQGRKRLRLAAMLCATAMTAPMFAAPALAAEDTEDDNTIVVNANKRDQAIEEVAGIVSFVDAETLATNGVTSVRDLSNVTTGFQLGNAGSISAPAVRGISTINAGSFENNVAVFIDGIYQTVPAAVNIDLPNIDNIQVLKGPQGTLYGRNATGGALLMTTINPTNEWRGGAEITYARFDDKRIGGYIAGPLSDRVGFAFAGYFRQTDGYYKLGSRTIAGQTDGYGFGNLQGSIRAKLNFDLTETFRVKFGYAFTRTEDPRGVFFTPTENTTTTDFRSIAVRQRGIAMHNYDPQIDFEQHEGSVTLELDTSIGTLKSLSAFSNTENATDFDFGGTYSNDGYSFSTTRDRMWQESLDFNIDAIENVDLIVGGTYFKIKTDSIRPNTTLLNFSGNNPNGFDIALASNTIFLERLFNRTKEAWAGFIDVTFHPSERLAINVGGRYSDETQRIRGFQFGTGGRAGGIRGYDTLEFERNNPGRRFRSSENAFTPRASITYEIADRTNIYASYAKGFRSGEWNSAPPITSQAGAQINLGSWAPTRPEKVDSFEIGLKHGGDGLRFELAGFYSDYRDLQLSRTSTLNNAVQVILSNARKARIYGVEGSVDYEVMENFNVHAGFTWLNARYGSGVVFSGTGVNPTAAVGTIPNDDPLKALRNISLEQDISGNPLPRAPDFTAFLGFDYRIPNEDGGITFAANAKYTSKYVPTNPSIFGGELAASYEARRAIDPNVLPNNASLFAGSNQIDRAGDPRTIIPGFVQLSASVTWADPTDTYYVRAWGKNLTNKIFAYHYNPITSGTYIQISEPRTYGLTMGFKFREAEPAPAPVVAPPPPPPAPPPPPPIARPVCNKGPFIVFFDWDQSAITSEAAMVLDSAVAAYPHCDRVPVMLAGHADRSGSTRYNVGLSERRNGEVRGYLTARGIPDGSITGQAFGESQNRVPTEDGVRELQNRRVEVSYGPGSGW